MIRVNIADAKAHLSRYLGRVEQGEIILLCRRNVPVAEIRPLPKPPRKSRPVGIDRGMTIPPSFFEPLPQDLLDAFRGGDPKFETPGRSSRKDLIACGPRFDTQACGTLPPTQRYT